MFVKGRYFTRSISTTCWGQSGFATVAPIAQLNQIPDTKSMDAVPCYGERTRLIDPSIQWGSRE